MESHVNPSSGEAPMDVVSIFLLVPLAGIVAAIFLVIVLVRRRRE